MFCPKNKKFLNNRGNILLFSIVFGVISFSIIVTAISSYAIFENRASIFKHNTEQAFNVAEAGVAYYRWHLAHDNNDFQDGTTSTGPYIHEFKDANGEVVGHYSLNIIPPDSSSTAVVIESTGWLDNQPESRRTVRSRMTPVSLTDYAYVLGTGAWIKPGMEIHGKFHSNGGVRFDGTSDAQVTSAVQTYQCNCSNGCCNSGGQTKPGVWGSGGPEEFWSYPMPAKDIAAITPKITNIRDAALDNGLYLPSSGTYGWYLTFSTSSQIVVRKVNWVRCYILFWNPSYHSASHHHNHHWWWWTSACFDIGNDSYWGTYDMPANNFIYVNDNVWVDGTVNGRATLAVSDEKNIIINDNLKYLAKDGNHVLALVAKSDILIPYNSPDDMEIDAVLASQEGSIMRHYYLWYWHWWHSNSDKAMRDHLTTYGSIISQDQWIWYYDAAWYFWDSGYLNTSSTYDTNLSTNPPPGFPFTAEYQVVDWEEVIE